MEAIDIIFLVILASFALFGLWFGFIHTLGSFLGTILGAYVASRWYETMAIWMIALTGWDTNFSRVISFVIAFLVINRLVGFGFWIVDKILSVVTRLPFISSLNRLLGLILGFAEGAITLGLIIFFIERFPLSEGFMTALASSTLAPQLSFMAAILWPLLPDAIRLLQSTVDYVSRRVIETIVDIASSTLP